MSHFYLIGIAGTAMAAGAQLLKAAGHTVSGSDEAIYPPMSDVLAAAGIAVKSPYASSNVPNDANTIFIIGNAMSRGNPEVEAVLANRRIYRSLPEVLRAEILEHRKPIIVAGTHGKTTTTSLIAHLFDQAGYDPGFLIGGVPGNFASGARLGSGEYFAIEGDEYDTAFFDKRSKFLHYVPQYAVMLNLEFDHADIFNSIEEIELAFYRLMLTVPSTGALIYNGEDVRIASIAQRAKSPVISFGIDIGDIHCRNAIETNRGWHGKIVFAEQGEFDFQLPFNGRHMLMNCLASVAVGYAAGVDLNKFIAGLSTFEGVARRVETIVDGAVTLLDDFGHHPTAVKTTLDGIRKRYPNRRILAAFDPRSNTSVRKFFQTEWATALASADQVWINQLHRLEKIDVADRLNRAQLIDDIQALGTGAKACDSIESILECIASAVAEGDVIVLFSNGSFGGLKEKLSSILLERFGSGCVPGGRHGLQSRSWGGNLPAGFDSQTLPPS